MDQLEIKGLKIRQDSLFRKDTFPFALAPEPNGGTQSSYHSQVSFCPGAAPRFLPVLKTQCRSVLSPSQRCRSAASPSAGPSTGLVRSESLPVKRRTKTQ
jgi:hypothetical protein